jgi:hypothetical protein
MNNKLMSDTPKNDTFNPADMQSIVDKLKAEGRMPTPELLDAAMGKARARYQKEVAKARLQDGFRARKRSASKSSQKTS